MALVDLIVDGNLAKVRAAIAAGADLEGPNWQGLTPLMLACREGQVKIAQLLLDHGARLDVAGPKGETALVFAMVHCARIAEMLVERGVLGRPLRKPAAGTRLSPSECDVCTRYPDLVEPNDRYSGTPARLAWLDIVSEKRSSEGKTDYVERELRCPFCGTRYEQLYANEVETPGVTLPDVSESIRRVKPPTAPPAATPSASRAPAAAAEVGEAKAPPDTPYLPAALLGALFVAEDGKLACRIQRGDGDAPFRVTVWAGAGGGTLLSAAHTTWRPPQNLRSEHANERLGRLQAELGLVGVGNLYTFYVVRRNPDLQVFGDKEWIATLPATPLAEVRLFPEYGGSPYMPDDWDWQEGWWYPYSTFRPATAEEEAAHARAK